jgi:predicted nucleic acid-binding protein
MPLRVVVDASVFLASVLNETYTPNAQAVLSQWNEEKREICAPLLFQYEVAATLRRRVYMKDLTTEEARKRADLILGLDIVYFHDRPLLMRGFEIATELNRPRAYDSQYLALAERLNCEFWTTDERLVNSVQANYSWVRGLHQITP